MKKQKTMSRKDAVKKDGLGKIGKQPFQKDKVADDIRSAVNTEKININIRPAVAKGLTAITETIQKQLNPDSKLMKILKGIETQAEKVEKVRRPATKIARKAISDISAIPEVKSATDVAVKAVSTVKKEILQAVRTHMDEMEASLKSSFRK